VGDNVEEGIFDTRDALKIAQEQSLDLVEIAPKAKPPVCKVIDYSKFKYEQKKKQKELQSKQQKVVVKEVRFGPNTDEHDFKFKLRHAEGFLRDGNKVKAYVHFVGRSILFKERGAEILERFYDALQDLCKVDQPPKMEGKRMIMYISPKKGILKNPSKKNEGEARERKIKAPAPQQETPEANDTTEEKTGEE